MSFWKIENAAENQTPELFVYGYIGEWDEVDSKNFTSQLKQITAKELIVRINSYGGEVFTAQAILSSLKRHPANVTVYIDGIAASAASVIAMAGNKVIMPSNAMMMIHNPLTIALGNSGDMRDVADMLDKVRDSILAAYRDKTGLEDDRIIELMNEETWMTAAEAVEFGFADEVEQSYSVAACIDNGKLVVNGMKIDPSRFKNVPAQWIAESQQDDKGGSGTGENENPGTTAGKPEARKEKKPMDLEQLKAEHPDLCDKLLAQGEEAGVKKERERIQAIEEMELSDHRDLISAAKFDKPVTAEALAVQVLKAQKDQRQKITNDRKQDAEDMEDPGAETTTDPTSQEAKDKADLERLTNAGKAGFGAKRK